MKKFVTGLVFVALAAAIGIGAGFYFTHQSNGSATQAAAIEETKAQDLALRDAGVAKNAVTHINSRFERDDGRALYKVQFAVNHDDGRTTLYEYEVDAQNGKILSKEQEHAGRNTNGQAPQDANALTSDEATAIALKHAGVSATEALFVHAEYEANAAGGVWSVDFETAATEYDYDISADNGEVLASSHEPRG